MMRTAMMIASVCACACGPANPHHVGGDDSDANAHGDGDNSTVDALGCTKMDVLFVIDNSGSMGEEQTNLVANFPMFISVLDQSGLDYRVGVTTTGRDYAWTEMTPIGNIPDS